MNLSHGADRTRSVDEEATSSAGSGSSGHVNFYDNHLWTPSVELETVRSMHFNAILPKLRALLPRRKYEREVGFPSLPAGDQAYSQAYFCLLSVSFSNGLAGLVDFPVPAVLAYLQMRFTSQPISDFMSSLGRIASRSFAESLLKCSIEAGRADIVDFLLGRTDFGLEANRNIITVGAERLTLTEFAAFCQSIAVIKVLVKHGADITKSIEQGSIVSNWLKSRRDSFNYTKDRDLLELGRMLLEAGGSIREETLHRLMDIQPTGPITQLIELATFQGIDELNHEALISHAVIQLQPEVSMRMIQIFTDAGIGLQGHKNILSRQDTAWPAIDTAARKGNLDLVRLLHEYGVSYSSRTFDHAVHSGNQALMRYLILDDAIPDRTNMFSCDVVYDLYLRGSDLLPVLQAHAVSAREYAREIHCSQLISAAQSGSTESLATYLDATIVKQMRSSRELARSRSMALRCSMEKALEAGLEPIACFLLEAGANIHDKIVGRAPILIQALSKKFKRLVRALIEAGVLVNYQAEGAQQQQTPLMLATQWGERDIVQQLLHAGADVDATSSRLGPDEACSALSMAVVAGDVHMATMLLEAGAGVDTCISPNPSTPLSIAVKNQDMAMFQLLLAFGADPTHPSVLLKALDCDHPLLPQLIRALEETYPSRKKKFDPIAVQELIRKKDIAKLRRILQLLGPRIDLQRYSLIENAPGSTAKGQQHETPLGTATRSDQSTRVEATQLLLQCGIDPNEVVSWREQRSPDLVIIRKTALLEAVSLEDANLVHFLIKHGADVNQPATQGIARTPLQQAAEQGNYDIVRLLLQAGANVNEGPAHVGGATALQLAAIGGSVGIVELLIEHGADVDAPAAKIDGKTAIEGAAEHGRLEVVKYLLQVGVKIDIDNYKTDCLEMKFATANGHFAVAELLQAHINERRAKERRQQSLLEANRLRTRSGPSSMQEGQSSSAALASEQLSGEEEGGESTRSQEAYSSTDYVCQQCWRRLSNASALARHIRSLHSDIAQHECNICHKLFKRKDVLLRHKSTTHARSRQSGKVACEHCGVFFRQDYLRGHHLTPDGRCKKQIANQAG